VKTVSNKVVRHSLTSVSRISCRKETVRLLLLDIRSWHLSRNSYRKNFN